MLIAIPVFDRLTTLDAIGPYEVLQRLPDARVTFVGHRTGPVVAQGGLELAADAAFEDVTEARPAVCGGRLPC